MNSLPFSRKEDVGIYICTSKRRLIWFVFDIFLIFYLQTNSGLCLLFKHLNKGKLALPHVLMNVLLNKNLKWISALSHGHAGDLITHCVSFSRLEHFVLPLNIVFTSHFLPLSLVPYFTLTLIEGLSSVVGTFASIKGAVSRVEGNCSCILL